MSANQTDNRSYTRSKRPRVFALAALIASFGALMPPTPPIPPGFKD